MEALWFLSIPFALSIGSPALALQSCNLVNRFTDAVQTYNVHTRDSIRLNIFRSFTFLQLHQHMSTKHTQVG